MSKIQVKVTLLTPEINYVDQYNAIFHPDQNEITYNEKDDTKTKINTKALKLRRENEKLIMEYKFVENSTTVGKVFLKDFSKKIELKINTKKIKQNTNNLEIEYELENEIYKYKIEVL